MNELDSCDYLVLQRPGTNEFLSVSKQVAAGHLTRSNIEHITGFTKLPVQACAIAQKPIDSTVKIMWLYEVKR